MNDDDLLDRLRRAAADVPPSTLDLTAVLRSARRKRTRHRTVVASGCVAAVAGVGAVAPALPGLLPPWPASDVAAAALGPSCPGEIVLDWDRMEIEPVVRATHVAGVDVDGTSRTLGTSRRDGSPEVQASAELPGQVRDAVLRAAREQDEAGIYYDGELFDEVGGRIFPTDEELYSSEPPFAGFVAAEDGGDPGLVPLPAGLGPGVHVAFEEGLRHTARGTARCGGTQHLFRLTYTEPTGGGELDCRNPVLGIVELAVQAARCPDGVPPHRADGDRLTEAEIADLVTDLELEPAVG
jgi:hypothetical protein